LGSKPPWTDRVHKIVSQKKLTAKKRDRGVAQGVGSKVKPQFHRKKKKK
jgi:hypothetical protein